MATQYRKAEKPKILTYFPTKAYGQEGDTVVSKIAGKGVFFCVKAGGLWYAQTTMQPLSKINTAYIKDLQSDKLTLKRIENAGLDTNKFIVLKDNSIRYRTGNNILDDLDVFASKKINFKTAYCSLGQYSSKQSCEANGGTWYYSENDSHDSISSTPENQLLTTGQEIGTMDSESTLTYDGSTLEIKYNSDYDDNWQTSAQTDLLKLSYDSDNFGTIRVTSLGAMSFIVGGDDMLKLSEKGDDGNEVNFGSSCVGFTQLEPTFNASTTVVDFRHSNKQFVTFDGFNITNISVIFPLVSGNFVLLLKQDGTGSRTVTNWKAMEFDESSADGSAAVKFAGGSNPTLTTDANHVDILSFYWDADNEIAYGVATLDFQF